MRLKKFVESNKYKLAAQVVGFYDAPFWNSNNPKPIWWDLFDWNQSSDRSRPHIYVGYLKEELFDTLDKKIAYLQGVFEGLSDGYGILHGENWIQFANSCKKAERCKKWLNEIAREYLLSETSGSGIIKHTIEYHYPICHKIEIHPKVVEFVRNYQLK